VKANPKIGCLLVAFFLVPVGDLSAQFAHESAFEPEPEMAAETSPAPHRFSLSGKVSYHTFWKQGLLKNGADYGRSGLGVSSLSGVGGEIDFDYHWRPFMVFSATLGGYQGKSEEYEIEVITGYLLATAKLQKVTRVADYYVGAGLGAYFSRMKADGTAYALKPGLHGLVGMRFHVTPRWSVLLEDRLAFTLRAEEGFGDLDLGGNFVMLGGSHHF
jgi:hypothetical protein